MLSGWALVRMISLTLLGVHNARLPRKRSEPVSTSTSHLHHLFIDGNLQSFGLVTDPIHIDPPSGYETCGYPCHGAFNHVRKHGNMCKNAIEAYSGILSITHRY